MSSAKGGIGRRRMPLARATAVRSRRANGRRAAAAAAGGGGGGGKKGKSPGCPASGKGWRDAAEMRKGAGRGQGRDAGKAAIRWVSRLAACRERRKAP